ncbi:MAG TPA: hypothetical protein VGH20_07135 [Myxococcales bacterium]
MSVNAQTLIAVRDVKASSAWYQKLLGLRSPADPNHPHRLVYERLYCGETMLLQIHRWDVEEHPNLVGADRDS